MEALLAQPGQDVSKGIFGGYNDAVLHRWSALMDAYQKNWCHMAECAQLLLQNVKYEIPNQRKQVERSQRQLLELDKRESALEEEAASFVRQYERNCVQLGISTDAANVTAELEALVHKLPRHYEAIVAAVSAPPVRRALDYYGVFCGYTEAIARQQQQPWAAKAVCPALAFVVRHGNVARLQYERALDPLKWATVAAPTSSSSSSLSSSATAPSAGRDAIEIDWNAGAAADAAEADWAIELDDGQPSGATAAIDLVDDDAVQTPSSSSSSLDELARRYAIETVLGSLESRNAFLDDLHELLAFLQGRLREKMAVTGAASGMADAITASADCPDALRSADAVEVLQTLRDAVQDALRLCESAAFVQLLEIQASKRYVARLAASVRKKLEMAEQLRNQVEFCRDKRRELQRELEAVRPRLKLLADRSIKVQKTIVEQQLSKRLGGRTVQLTGDINNLQ